MVLRVVIVVLVVAVILWLLTARSRARAGKAAPKPRQPESFARCAQCGGHLPLNDAVVDRDIAYCSEAHRLAGPRDHGGS
ncbi:MAG TPA: PP0621 family protein [Burkholderiaceae bacterium]